MLLLSPRYTSDSRQLRCAAEETGWQVLRQADWRPPQRAVADEVVLYGEPLFVDVMAAGLDLAVLECPADWLARLPETITQRAVSAMTLVEARNITQSCFVKPALSKVFPAGIYVMATQPPPSCDERPDDLPVLVAEPVRWEIEFRGFVLQRRLLALSPYVRDDLLVEDTDGNWIASDEEWHAARTFYEQILADSTVELAPAIVLDVGLIAARGWAVIEANGAWGAGLYGCDPAAVLPVVRHATLPRESLRPSSTGRVRAWSWRSEPRGEIGDTSSHNHHRRRHRHR